MDIVYITKKIRESNICKKDIFDNDLCSLYFERSRFFKLLDKHPNKKIVLKCTNLINDKLYGHYRQVDETIKYANKNPFYQKGKEFNLDYNWIINNIKNPDIVKFTSAWQGDVDMININSQYLSEFLSYDTESIIS